MIQVGDLEEARFVYKTASNTGIYNSRLIVENARVMILLKRLSEAKNLCSIALSINHKEALAYHYRGVISYEEGNFIGAKKDIEHAIDLDRKNSEPYYYKIAILAHLKEFDALKEFIENVYHHVFLRQVLDFELLESIIGEVIEETSDFTLSEEILDESRRLSKARINQKLNDAAKCNISKRFESAEKILLDAYQIAPRNIHVINELVYAYTGQKKYEYAYQTALKCLEIDKNHVNGLQNLAWAAYFTQRFEESFKHCTKGLEMDASNESLIQLKKNLESKGFQNHQRAGESEQVEENTSDESDSINEASSEVSKKVDLVKSDTEVENSLMKEPSNRESLSEKPEKEVGSSQKEELISRRYLNTVTIVLTLIFLLAYLFFLYWFMFNP
jgi:tetratricopeptide (TPR) repeat protein